MRKAAFCICKNKDADQLRGNREADQRLRFRYLDSAIPLLPNPKFQASSHILWLYSPVCVGPGRSPKTSFLIRRLILPFLTMNSIWKYGFYTTLSDVLEQFVLN